MKNSGGGGGGDYYGNEKTMKSISITGSYVNGKFLKIIIDGFYCVTSIYLSSRV